MNAMQILAEVDLKYPNDVDPSHKWSWILTLEKQLLDECLLTHEISDAELEKAEEIHALKDMPRDYEPLAQPPYYEVYVHFLGMQIALVNTDTDQYENEQALYNNALLAYKKWFNRNHRAKGNKLKWRF